MHWILSNGIDRLIKTPRQQGKVAFHSAEVEHGEEGVF